MNKTSTINTKNNQRPINFFLKKCSFKKGFNPFFPIDPWLCRKGKQGLVNYFGSLELCTESWEKYISTEQIETKAQNFYFCSVVQQKANMIFLHVLQFYKTFIVDNQKQNKQIILAKLFRQEKLKTWVWSSSLLSMPQKNGFAYLLLEMCNP